MILIRISDANPSFFKLNKNRFKLFKTLLAADPEKILSKRDGCWFVFLPVNSAAISYRQGLNNNPICDTVFLRKLLWIFYVNPGGKEEAFVQGNSATTCIFTPSLKMKNIEMIRNWLFFGLALIVFNGCVPARKLVYLQKDEELKERKEIPTDTILRSHALDIQEYRIQPLDILSIAFETLSDENDAFDFLGKLSSQSRGGGSAAVGAAATGIVVNIEGEVEFPVLGSIRVSGLTLFQAQDSIKMIASKFVPDVIVRVRMLNFRFTVLGEVNGEKTVTSLTTRLTMMEAIGQAGGFGELADRSRVKVIRQTNNKAEIFYVNLLKEEYLESPYYYIQQNDVMIVPPLKQRTFRRYFTSNIGIITTTISFAILIYSLSIR